MKYKLTVGHAHTTIWASIRAIANKDRTKQYRTTANQEEATRLRGPPTPATQPLRHLQ